MGLKGNFWIFLGSTNSKYIVDFTLEELRGSPCKEKLDHAALGIWIFSAAVDSYKGRNLLYLCGWCGLQIHSRYLLYPPQRWRTGKSTSSLEVFPALSLPCRFSHVFPTIFPGDLGDLPGSSQAGAASFPRPSTRIPTSGSAAGWRRI